jgi:orotidine-5'-phosphate decarboxylase
MTGIFCAIDAANMQDAQDLVRKLSRVDIGIKVGLELFVAEGPFCVERLRELKGGDFITIHTSGGTAMMRAAIDAAQDAAVQFNCPLPALLGVTVLTHMDDSDLDSVGQQKPAGDQVLRLAQLADSAGLQGVICSPLEIASLRAKLSTGRAGHPSRRIGGRRPETNAYTAGGGRTGRGLPCDRPTHHTIIRSCENSAGYPRQPEA